MKIDKPNNPRFIDIEGNIYGKLKVIGYAGKINTQPYWWVKCDCGSNIKKVRSISLKNGDITSCGCNSITSLVSRTKTHGRTKSPEYVSYSSAKARCENPNNDAYHHYGGRGIEFRFNSFEEFLNEIGERPEPKQDYSIERINVNGHYEVGNIKWETRKNQNRNRRNNRVITHNNQTKCIVAWAEEYNQTLGCIEKRLENKWCFECALSIPVGGNRCLHQYEQLI